MTDFNKPVTEEDLHAYADAQLSNGNLARVEAWLKHNPADAEKVRAWQAQNCLIQTLFEPYQKSLPGDVERVRTAKVPATPRGWSRIGLVAAGVCLFALGALTGRFLPMSVLPETASDEAIPAEARSAHLIYSNEVRHPVEVRADEKDHLVAWLGKRLGTKLIAPDLTGLGFTLVGGRLVPVNASAGAMLMYEDKSGKRLTVLLGRSEESTTTSFRMASEGSIETFYWIDDDLSYAVTGEIPRETMQKIADTCYRQMEEV